MKLEDVLKKQGFSDADIAAASTLLGDQKFRGAVETAIGGLEQDLTAFRQENDRWADWAEKTNKPQVEALQQQRLELTARAGSLEARLKAVDPTFTPGATPGAPPERTANPSGDFDPAKHGLLTRKDFEEEVTRYASAQGMAIAQANNLAAEYRKLTGGDMLDYQTRDADGRQMEGMVALLHEARTNKKALPDYIAEKFDFAGKRAQATAAAKQAAEKAIRDDERTKVVAEYGNPNTRPGMMSTQPFVPVRTGEAAGKMPWEVPATERRNARISRALETQARSTVQ